MSINFDDGNGVDLITEDSVRVSISWNKYVNIADQVGVFGYGAS